MEVLEDMSLRQESGTKGPWLTAAGLQQLPRQAVHPGCPANQGPGLREPSESPWSLYLSSQKLLFTQEAVIASCD